MERHYFKPIEFGGDFCGTCSGYFTEEIHLRSHEQATQEQLNFMRIKDLADTAEDLALEAQIDAQDTSD